MRFRKADPSKRRFASHRCKLFTEWVSETQRCLICHRPAEPAHVVPRARGSDDLYNVVNLCHRHHMEQEGQTAAFEVKYHVDLAAHAHSLTQKFLTLHRTGKLESFV